MKQGLADDPADGNLLLGGPGQSDDGRPGSRVSIGGGATFSARTILSAASALSTAPRVGGGSGGSSGFSGRRLPIQRVR